MKIKLGQCMQGLKGIRIGLWKSIRRLNGNKAESEINLCSGHCIILSFFMLVIFVVTIFLCVFCELQCFKYICVLKLSVHPLGKALVFFFFTFFLWHYFHLLTTLRNFHQATVIYRFQSKMATNGPVGFLRDPVSLIATGLLWSFQV